MKLGFCLSVLFLSTILSGWAFAVRPDIHSNSALRHSRQTESQPNGHISDRPGIEPAQTDKIIISMNNRGLEFKPGRAEDLGINKIHFSPKTGNIDNTKGEPRPSTLPIAFWLLGFGIILWVLSFQRTRDNSDVA